MSGCRSPRCQASSARYAPPVPSSGSEKCERARGRAGDRAPGGAGRSGCRERAEVVGRFAANEADRHREHTERDEEADRGGSVAQSRVRRLLLSSFDGDAGAAAAVRRAELIWADVSGDGVWMNQPAATGFSPNFSSACAVSSVSGAEVYFGSFTVWIVGCQWSGPLRVAGPGPGLAPFTRHSVCDASHGLARPLRGAMIAKPARSVRPVMTSVFGLMALGLIP